MSKSNLTIKDALIDDQSVIKKLAAELKETDPKATNATALSHIIQAYLKNSSGHDQEAQIIIEEKNQEIENLKIEIETLKNAVDLAEATINENDQLKASLAEHEKIAAGLADEIAELRNQTPETVTVEVEKKLGTNQFILQVNEDVYPMARKCRKFLIQDGRIKSDGNNPAEFFNELTNTAIKYYLENKYDQILK